MPRFLILAFLVAVVAPSAAAAEGDSVAPRYGFVPVAGGALRLDTETGEVSLCIAGEKAAVCTSVAENVRLTTGERAKLKAKITELDARVAALEASAWETADRADDAAMDRVKLLAERMMRHFVGAVRGVKHDNEGDEL
jgi:hypothetical protein